jgi:hypothetical protein
MPFGIVLLKREVWVLRKYILNNRYYYTTIRAGAYRLPILLPEEPSIPPISTTYTPPKHPPYLSLVPRFDTIVVE